MSCPQQEVEGVITDQILIVKESAMLEVVGEVMVVKEIRDFEVVLGYYSSRTDFDSNDGINRMDDQENRHSRQDNRGRSRGRGNRCGNHSNSHSDRDASNSRGHGSARQNRNDPPPVDEDNYPSLNGNSDDTDNE